ncbi:hypothetical protein [Microtetraspora fusca]|uniref:hypothetical protein n=1 Tax=Microtetraspora fusca TaxID=1997 RepID=UPI0008347162|nr:hypothetical protein [Microtetraspora fusca]
MEPYLLEPAAEPATEPATEPTTGATTVAPSSPRSRVPARPVRGGATAWIAAVSALLPLVSGCRANPPGDPSAATPTGVHASGRPGHRPTPTVRTPTPPAPARAWPGPDDTGVPPGVRLRPSTSFTVTRDGMVVDGLEVTGSITVEADNVTIRNTRVRGVSDYWGILQRKGHTGLTVEDSEVFGNGRRRTQFGILNQGVMITVRRVEIHTISKGVSTDQGLVEDSYLHDPKYYSGDHTDMIMSNGPAVEGTELIIRHNTIVNTLDQTGAVSLFQDFGVVRNVTVQDNLLAGGGWTLYAGAGGKGASSNVKIVDNVFSRRVWRNGGSAGPVAYWDAHGRGNVWRGNTWEDGGTVTPG